MKLSLSFPEFWQGVGQLALDEWHRVIAAIQDWSKQEHHDDGTHGDVHADTITSEDTRLNVGLLDGEVGHPSLYFVSHSESAQGEIRGAVAWPGFYMKSNTYPQEWGFAGTTLDGGAFGPLFSISTLGIVPVVTGLVLGAGTSGSIPDEELWGTIGGDQINAEALNYRVQRVQANAAHSITTTGTVAALNLEVDDHSYHEFNGAGTLTTRGILQPTDVRVAPMHILHNNSANNWVLNHNDGAASAAHRIQTHTGANLTIGQFDTVVLFHNGTDWRVQSSTV